MSPQPNPPGNSEAGFAFSGPRTPRLMASAKRKSQAKNSRQTQDRSALTFEQDLKRIVAELTEKGSPRA